MSRKQKLELTWVGKEVRAVIEPRILLEVKELSYYSDSSVPTSGLVHTVIEGDNLLAVKALETDYRGSVGCIYIDPPYNTGAAFADYEDGIEHSLWLCHMRDRLEVLWRLLRADRGVLLISINDDEAHYLKVLCDELFGRKAFRATLVWNTEGNTDNQSKVIRYHEYILVYCKGELPHLGVVDPNIKEGSKLTRDEIRNTIVKNGPRNPRSIIEIPSGFPAAIENGIIRARKDKWPHILDDVYIKNFKTINKCRFYSGWSSKDICEAFIRAKLAPVNDTKGQQTTFEITATGAIEAVKIRAKDKGHFISVLRGFGTTNQMRIMLEKLGLRFTFPKPVGLIEYLLSAFSEDNDLIVDSYAGSGTTGHAVLSLNKNTGSSRQFILIEQFSNTTNEVLLPRLKAVIDGNGAAEIPRHGSGFRVFRLAPSLLRRDKWGNWIISPEYNAPMLAEAMCKHTSFTYAPSQNPLEYWNHGFSSECDFIYVTTQALTYSMLKALSHDVGPDRHLLICCKAFSGKTDEFTNLTVRRIPQAVLANCEWGRDDYSLRIAALPEAKGSAIDEMTSESRASPQSRRRKAGSSAVPDLFDQPAETEA